jgi:hypothetical protein
MIKFNKLDFQLCQIPEHLKIVYIFVINDETYLTFDYQYLQTVLKQCTDVEIKRLQATNRLQTKFTSKKIVNTKNKLFKLIMK